MKSNNSSLSELEKQSSSLQLKDLLEALRISNKSKDISELERQGEEEISSLEEHGKLRYRKRLQDLVLQKIWFWILVLLLITVTIGMFAFILFLGLGYLNYGKYKYFPHSVLGTFCGYFFSLSKIVTKYLYSK